MKDDKELTREEIHSRKSKWHGWKTSDKKEVGMFSETWKTIHVSKAKSRLRLKSQSCDISLKIKKGVLILSLLKFKDSERNWGKWIRFIKSTDNEMINYLNLGYALSAVYFNTPSYISPVKCFFKECDSCMTFIVTCLPAKRQVHGLR